MYAPDISLQLEAMAATGARRANLARTGVSLTVLPVKADPAFLAESPRAATGDTAEEHTANMILLGVFVAKRVLVLYCCATLRKSVEQTGCVCAATCAKGSEQLDAFARFLS